MKLVVLCQDPDGPVVRHRIRAIEPHLRAAGFDVVVHGVASTWWKRQRLLSVPDGQGVTLIVRKLFTSLDLARLSRTRVVFDLDDAVMMRDPFGRKRPSYARPRRFRRVVREAQLVMAGNAFLVGKVEEVGRERLPVKLAPTPIDTHRFTPGPGVDDVPRIGWIGSRSTRPYLSGIADPLARVLAARPDARVAVMADAAPELPFDVEFTPWSEEAEVPFLRSLSVGVMPLTDDDWSRGKCGFKMLQYMACGVPAVASPVGVNVEIADDGDAARLASSAAEWETTLLSVLDDAGDLSDAGRAHVEQRYSADVLGPRYADELARCARDERQ